MSFKNRTVTRARDAQVIVGIQKDLKNVSVPVAGETFTPATLTALLQSRIDAAAQVDTTRAAWLAAVKTYDTVDAKATPVVHGLKQYVLNAYGPTSPVLADFGFTTPKRAAQTPEKKAAAVAKRKATREARNTMGKKAKLAVKGNVTGIVVTPVTVPNTDTPSASAPAAPATPAPTTPAPAGTSPQAPTATPAR
jgi:hypothetical protein